MRQAFAVALVVSLIAQPAFAADPAPTQTPAPSAPASAPAVKRGEDVITPLGSIWRSTLVPGWGQRYKGEKKKGWIFTGVAAGLAGASAMTYVNARGFTLPTAKHPGGAQGAYDSLTDPNADYEGTYRNSVDATILAYGVASATAAFWLYNLSDSAFTPLEHLRVKDARVKDVFPAMSKFYEDQPLVQISVENRSSEPVNKVKVKFQANEIMDAPAESAVVETIPPGLGKSINVTAAFNKNVFNVGASEPVPVAGKITIEYEVGNKKRDITRTATFTVYNRNAIVWDDMRKMAAWVTPREEGVKAFASAVARKGQRVTSAKSLATAVSYFDALGAYGMTYVADPQAPFNYFDGNAEAVDYIAYPRETLTRRTGDCDDLTALYAALLESSGIPTALVDVPGHVFLMFDSGLTPDEARPYISENLRKAGEPYIVRNGTAWIPVEVTAVGKSFTESWAQAAAQVRKWNGLDQLKLVEVLDAQNAFPPSPPAFEGTADATAKAFLEDAKAQKTFASLIARDKVLGQIEEKAREQRVADIKNRKLPPASENNEIGIVYARDGQFDKAVQFFSAAIQADPKLAKAHNNLANVYYLQGNNQKAVEAYRSALTVGGENAAILVNIASLYYEMGDRNSAKTFFQRAVRIEPVYEKEYPEIAALARPDGAKVAGKNPNNTGTGKAAAIGAGERDPRRSRWIP